MTDKLPKSSSKYEALFTLLDENVMTDIINKLNVCQWQSHSLRKLPNGNILSRVLTFAGSGRKN